MPSAGPPATVRIAPLLALALLATSCGEPRRLQATSEVPTCLRCHGFPPDTGAHLAHARPPPGTYAVDLHLAEDHGPLAAGYDFGCAHCHPSIDPEEHVRTGGTARGPAQRVVLTPPAPPVEGDRLKARNHPDAAYDPASGTCSGVYCHSTGQEDAGFDRDGDLALDRTPSWRRDRALGALGCGACHGNPPAYPSGGPGTATANSHLDLDDFGWETGHFAGMAGPTHGSKHGGGNPLYANDPQQAAAPITCQACHFETVAEGAGRFFFLDTTGDYHLDERPQGDPARVGTRTWEQAQCASCHAPAREGSVLPLRHVNGRRDVAFDARPALPAGFATGLPPLATGGPVRPYYVSHFLPRAQVGTEVRFRFLADSELRATTTGGDVFTTTLASATYDPATKTCANVGCHVGRQSLVDAGIVGPLRWGQPFVWSSGCNGCHNELGPPLPP